MIFWVALAAAAGLTALTLRSMVFAVAHTLDTRSAHAGHAGEASSIHDANALTRRETFFLCIEIAITVGIALATIGLAATAAMPAHLLIGALLAQVAVLGSLVAPPIVYSVGSIGLRPAALALGVAQLAQLGFLIRALQALL